MADLELTFIGSGNAFVREGACWNGFVANGRYLFEAPPQALMSLNRLGIDPNAIDAVVLSHHHGDHLLGLPFLLLHWKYLGRTTPVTVIGPPETEDVVRDRPPHIPDAVRRRRGGPLGDGDAGNTAGGRRPRRGGGGSAPRSEAHRELRLPRPQSPAAGWGTPATAPSVTVSSTSRGGPRYW